MLVHHGLEQRLAKRKHDTPARIAAWAVAASAATALAISILRGPANGDLYVQNSGSIAAPAVECGAGGEAIWANVTAPTGAAHRFYVAETCACWACGLRGKSPL